MPTLRRLVRGKFNLRASLAAGLAFLALSGATVPADAQTTYTCSSAMPSNNCAIAIAGSSTGTNTNPAGLSSSYLTVSGATGPVLTVQVVLDGVTSSVGDWAGYNQNNENVYSSVYYATFVLEDPAGNQLALLGSTGSGYDAMNGVTIAIQDGATVAPPLNEPNYGGAWPNTGSVTVAPGSYWELENIVPLYDSAPADLPQTDGSATLASKFTGATANGTWTLHLADSDQAIDYPLYVTDPVSISGWQLILTYSNLPSTTTTVTSSVNPSYTGTPNNTTTLTATVTSGGQPIGGGTVTFTANSSPIACTGGNPTVSGGTATCTTAFSAEGNYSIGTAYSGSSSYAPSNGGALYQLVTNHTTNPSGNTYCNPGNLATTGYTSTDLVYPSYVQVPATVTQSVANVSVQLNGLQSTNGTSGDVSSTSFLLVAPNKTNNLDFLSHVVTGNPQPSVDVTIADGNPLAPNGDGENGGVCNGGSGPDCDLQNGAYGATDDHQLADSFITQAGSPAPPSPNYPLPYGGTNAETFEQAFSGATAAGNWMLYVENDGGIPLNLSGGWCIDLSLNTGVATTTTVASGTDPAFTGNSVNITATVKNGGNPVNTGSVTFLDNGEPPTGGNNVITLNGSGQAVFTTSQLTEGDHKITASYGGASGYDPSDNYVWQRIDDATAVSGSNGAYSYCNTGAVVEAEGNQGAFTPNPSNIFVSGLPGTVKNVSLALDNFYTFSNSIDETEALVSGPAGAFDFFSSTGASGTVLSSGNYVFVDGDAAVPLANYGAGSYGPASYPNVNGNADSFFSSASGYYNAPGTFTYAYPRGSGTFESVFGGTNADGNGIWSLFFNQLLFSGPAGAQNGWCLNFTENAPAVSVTLPSTDSFSPGQQGASFPVTITNNGPGSTGDPTNGSNPMTVTDVLNSGLTFASGSGTGWTCSAVTQTVTCTNDSSIADGDPYPTLTIDVNVSDSATGTFNNSVTVSGAGAASTPSTTDAITITSAPVLSVVKSHSGTFTQGQTAQWSIAVSNGTGSGATSGTTTVSDPLPNNYTLSTYSGTGWTCLGMGTGTATCTSSQVVSGGSSFNTLVLTVSVPANSPTSVSNTALAWGGGDLTHTNSGNAAPGSDNNVPVVQVPASISINGSQTQSTLIGTAFGSLAVTVKDAAGVAIPNYPTVVFTAGSASGASGTFSNSTNTVTVAASNSGVADPGTFTANATPGGPYNLTVTAGTASASPAFSLTNTAPIPAQLVVSGYPSPVYVGVAHTGTVVVVDENGNPTGTSGIATITTSDSAATVTTPLTITNGTGTFTVTFETTGPQSIIATMQGASGSQTGIQVNPLPGYVVTTNTDDASGVATNCPAGGGGSDCSLRDALAAAQGAGEGNITFSATAFPTTNTALQNTITLTHGFLTIPNMTAIQGLTSGSGATLTNLVTVSGNSASAVFTVASGVTASIANLTIAKGSESTLGGGIATAGNLTISESTFSANSAGGGGAIFNTGTLVVTGSAFAGNSATSASGYGGAGIYNEATATVTNCTFSGNNAGAPTEEGGGGDGVSSSFGTMNVSGSTFAGNKGAVDVMDWGGTINVKNSILTEGVQNYSAAFTNNPGPVNADHDLFVSGSLACAACTTNTSPVTASSASVATLGNYGGPTQTLLPLPGSAAICAATAADEPGGDTTDQRGFPRTTTYNSTACIDLGADQSNYAISFTAEPPASGTLPATAMSPAPVVTVTESGSALTAGTASLSATDANSDLTITPATATTSATNGEASFSSLIFTSTTTSDTLTATLALNPSLSTLILSTTSSGFGVGAISAPVMTAQFGAPSIPLGGPTTLTFTIQNPNSTVALSGVGFTDALPAGLIVSTPNALSGSCGSGAITATSGGDEISLTGGTLATSATCTFAVSVTGTSLGLKNNTTSAVTSSNGGTGSAATASVTVLAPSLSVLKSHTGTFTEGQTATWTIQVSNTATGSATAGTIDVSDTLPTNYTLASYTSSASAWTCTGTGTSTVGCSSTTPITGGSSSTITLTVNVPYNSPASVSNTALAWGGSDPSHPTSVFPVSSTDPSVPVVQVGAPNFVVTTLTDDSPGNAADCPVGNSPASNDCTLRDAMLAADATDGGYGNITFNTGLTGTITLIGALPALTGQITISGPGANVITVSGNNSSTVGSIFTVNSGATGGISGLTIEEGNAISSGQEGGGINNLGTLAVTNCVLSNNTAGASGEGGGIYTDRSLTVSNTTFSSNSALGDGAAGGGIYNDIGGSLTVSYSTFSGNSAGSTGGGAINTLGPTTVSDSTFYNNSAQSLAGAIFVNDGATIVNNIFSSNSTSAPSGGAGIYVEGSETNPNYNLFYNNLDNGTTEDDCNGCGSNNNAITGQSPNLAALGNYGGPTTTMLPLPASSAICGGLAANIPNSVTTDQRGDPNTNTSYSGYNSATACVDLGAVQTNYSLIFSTEPGPISPATSILTNTNFEAGVTLNESGAPLTAAAETIPLTLTGTGTLTNGSATTSAGIASYSTLQVDTAGTSDMLNAGLALNPAASPAPVATAVSNPFNVGSPASPSLSVTVTHAGTFTQGGSSGELDITVTNSAVGSTTGSNAITVQGVLPSGTNNGHSWNYQLFSASGTGWSCGGPGGSCSYSLPVTGGNSTSTLMITVQVPTTSPATVPYSVSAYGGGDPVHTNSGTAVSSNTDNITVLQVPATVAITAGGTQSAPINSAFSTPLTVQVTDAAGVGIASQSVTFTAPPSGASGTFSNSTAVIIGTTASTGTVGQIAETFTANGTAGGPYSVTAIASTVGASPAFALTNLTATAMVTTWPTASAITYGQPLSASMLTGGVASVAGSFAFASPLTVPGAGTQSESVTFTPTSSSYSPVSQNVSVQVNKATPTVTWPTASPISSGQMLSASTLSGGSAKSPITNAVVLGKFAFTNPTLKPPAGTNPQPVMFTPTDTTDYTTVTSTVSVTVKGLATTVTKWPKASAITYGQPLSHSTLSGGNASVAGTFTFTGPLTVPTAGTHSESVTFTPTNPDYETVTGTVSVTVYQATPTVTWPTASAINHGQPLSASTLTGGSAVSPITDAVVLGGFAFTNPTATPSSTGPESVTFTPTDATDYEPVTGTVAVTVNGGGVPVANISPASINFGTLYLGSIVTKTVTVKNTGGATLTINDPLIAIVQGGTSNEFITVNLCPKSLAPGKSCTMTVTFVAGPFYSPQTATLTINDNAAGSPQKVMLYATVIDPVAQLGAGSLSFGTVKVGKSSPSQSVTLSNPGGTALTGIGIGVAGADRNDFTETNNCPSSLASKKSCTISVTFRPTATKSRSASITITNNAQNNPQSVSLSGIGD